jgi:hypothetical protein
MPEVKQLYEFLDGAIMVPDIRHHLWRSWGFCPRHTWAHATVELELGFGDPFSVGILYEDLAERAARLLQSHRRPSSILRHLRTRDACFTCRYLAISTRDDPRYLRHHRRANRRERTRRLISGSRTIWEQRSCPQCRDGHGPTCRLHLLEGAPQAGRDLGHDLAELAGRLQRLYRSFTWQGPTASPEDHASWIEALGWFAGWDFPDRLMGEDPRA